MKKGSSSWVSPENLALILFSLTVNEWLLYTAPPDSALNHPLLSGLAKEAAWRLVGEIKGRLELFTSEA